MKAEETQDREQKRQENLVEARRLKAQGNHFQAEEKYKSCIRIRNNFTKKVMEAVKEEFDEERRVMIIWSPYEADAQLTKLCIDNLADAVVTEDSDVLVYSAAAHVAFPVLFKLDRRTGNCDMISMHFLLSMSLEDADKAVKNNNSFEIILRNFASRQARRKGFGVRLFVQSCVLCGCDYSSNTLEGVGLIGAFKLVREQAYRNDNVRFKHVLQSLPPKVRKKLDMAEYEERLAKSEAVFFYHMVKHIGGLVKPLLTPRVSGEDDVADSTDTQHFPFMKRFDDWSFLGSSKKNDYEITYDDDVHREKPRISAPKSVPNESKAIATVKTKPVHNPYSKVIKKKGDERRPLKERTENASIQKHQTETHLNRGDKSQKRKPDVNIYDYLKDMPDTRYVRRKFPFSKTRSHTSARRSDVSSHWRQEQKGETSRNKSVNSLARPTNLFSRFQYDLNSPTKERDENDRTKGQIQREKACQVECEDKHLSLPGQDHIVNPDRNLEEETPSDKISSQQNKQLLIDLTEFDDEQMSKIDDQVDQKKESGDVFEKYARNTKEEEASFSTIQFEQEAATSKYFQKSSDTRRVTLDSERSSLEDMTKLPGTSASEQEFDNGFNASSKTDDSDGVVDSPDFQRSQRSESVYSGEGYLPPRQHQGLVGFFPKTKKASPRLSSRAQMTSKPKKTGPLLAGFKRQQEFFSQITESGQSESRSYAYSSAQKPKRLRDLTSYFQPTVTTTKPHFNQLPMNTNQSDEDFLWNG